MCPKSTSQVFSGRARQRKCPTKTLFQTPQTRRGPHLLTSCANRCESQGRWSFPSEQPRSCVAKPRSFNVCTPIARSLSTFTRDVPRTPRLFHVHLEGYPCGLVVGFCDVVSARTTWEDAASGVLDVRFLTCWCGPHCLFGCVLAEE